MTKKRKQELKEEIIGFGLMFVATLICCYIFATTEGRWW